MIGGEYDFLHDISNFAPKSIMDAGANIGMSTVRYAIMYPEATIVAVEPDDLNFKLLEMNTARFGNVRLEKKGLWDKHTGLMVKRASGWGWSTRVVEASRSQHPDVLATTIDLLMLKHNLRALDLLKIDIEGAEGTVFKNYAHPHTGTMRNWMATTPVVVAETHGPEEFAAVNAAFAARKEPARWIKSDELNIWLSPEVHMKDDVEPL